MAVDLMGGVVAPALRILSLGAGVQSTAVLLLALEGQIEPFHAAVFADTGDEPDAVYEHLERLEAIAGDRIPVHRVSRGGRLSDVTEGFVPVPLFFRRPGRSSYGMGQRQCTYQWKLRPLRARARELMAAAGASAVDMAVCISVDEIGRAKPSGRQWIRNVHPLLELGWSRSDCVTFLADRSLPAPRSACVYCPYRSDAEWLELRETDPAGWAAAVTYDESVRASGYVHRSLRPLAEVLLRPEDAGQMPLFEADCEGMCGI